MTTWDAVLRRRRALAPALGCLALAWVGVGCGAEADEPGPAVQGAALIELRLPVEAGGLQPFAAGKALRVRRGVPGGGLEDADFELRDDQVRVAPYEGDQPTRFVVEVLEGAQTLARAETAAAVIRASEADRALPALAVPPRTLVVPVDADGAPLLGAVAPGASVTDLGQGRLLVAGGDVAAAGSPCAPALPSGVRAEAQLVDLLALSRADIALVDGRAWHAAAPIAGGRVVLLGGYVGKGGVVGLSAGVEVVVPHAGKSEGASFDLARGRARAAVVSDGAQLLLVGGDEDGSAGGPATIERFDLAIGTLGLRALAVRRLDPAAVIVREPGTERRLLFVLGGRDGAGNSLSGGEVFELKGEEIWPLGSVVGPSPALTDAGWLATETPFAVLRVGGAGSGGASADVQSWSPQLGSWSPATPLAQPRACFAMASFDQELWIAGGVGADGAASGALERRGAEPASFELGAGRVGGVVQPGPGPLLLLAGGRDAAGAAAGLGLYWPRD